MTSPEFKPALKALPALLAFSALSALSALLAPPVAQAQGLRPLGAQTLTVPPVAAVRTEPAAQRAADFIVAIVNTEPITNAEVRLEAQRLAPQLAQSRQGRPPDAELARLVLERMINERAQLQLAKETGIRVDDVAVDQAEQNVAAQNQVDVATLRRRLASEGIGLAQYREQLRDQLVLIRLREREVESRVRVSDLEVDQFLREQANAAGAETELNLAQILIAVPENASPEAVAQLQAQANAALARARANEDFAQLAQSLSSAADRARGGQMGLRSADRYPPLFLDAIQGLAVGGVSNVVRSGAGFHILKVLEKRVAGMTVEQTRARHILLRPGPQLTEAQARDKLADYKRRVEAGQGDFAQLARENSQDGSAAQGGDLGWASPGQFVPEFEQVMGTLAPGQVSAPLVSRFGVHLIRVMERRTSTLSLRDQQEVVRSQLRQKKLEEAFVTWAQEVRGRAWVEKREAPQL